MRWAIILSFFAAALLLAADPAAIVRQAAIDWTQAVVKRDKAALQRLLADDLTFVHSNGSTIQNKAEYLAASERARYEALPLTDIDVHVYGKTAVLSAHIDTKNFGREPFRVRTLQVFVKKDDQWQLVAFQSTRVSPAPDATSQKGTTR